MPALPDKNGPSADRSGVQDWSGTCAGTGARASVYGELGERIRSQLPAGGAAASLGHFDFALLLPEPAATADLAAEITAPLPQLGDTLGLESHMACAGFPADTAPALT